jgi:hypothetical protein
MTKYEWTKRHIDEAKKEYPPDNPKYMDDFLAAVKEAGQSLTRVKFFELFDSCAPPDDDDDIDYFDYDVLSDLWTLGANFGEAWTIPAPEPLPRITTTAKFHEQSLPDDFCSLGGTPEWIQEEKYPICPQCDNDMVLFLQLKSLPFELTRVTKALDAFTFGDAGNFYIFHCVKCATHKISCECY